MAQETFRKVAGGGDPAEDPAEAHSMSTLAQTFEDQSFPEHRETFVPVQGPQPLDYLRHA